MQTSCLEKSNAELKESELHSNRLVEDLEKRLVSEAKLTELYKVIESSSV
jgi:hypothetical protein